MHGCERSKLFSELEFKLVDINEGENEVNSSKSSLFTVLLIFTEFLTSLNLNIRLNYMQKLSQPKYTK